MAINPFDSKVPQLWQQYLKAPRLFQLLLDDIKKNNSNFLINLFLINFSLEVAACNKPITEQRNIDIYLSW